MITRVLSPANGIDEQELVELAGKLLQEGELVAVPTETVYGLAADGLNPKAIQKIFDVKGRPQDNPLILHIGSIDQLYPLVKGISMKIEKLIDDLWPGPLTIVLPKSSLVPGIVTANGPTVAIRMPDHALTRKIIQQTGRPLAAPSANLSGRVSPTCAQHVFDDLNGKIPLIVDGGECSIGIESTVIDLSGDIPYILRPGFYTIEDLKVYLPDIRMSTNSLAAGESPKSPGQKYRHYAPKAKVCLYVGRELAILQSMKDDLKDWESKGRAVGVLTFDENREFFSGEETVYLLGSKNRLLDMARWIFARLRQMDQLGIEVILVQGVTEKGIGTAVMNRLKKSAEGWVKVCS